MLCMTDEDRHDEYEAEVNDALADSEEEAFEWSDDVHDEDAPGFSIVTCPDCGHPNLEFRTRCRKCRGPMLSPSNVTLGAHLMERGATDGPAPHDSPHAPVRVLSVLAFVLFLLFLPVLVITFQLDNLAVLLIIVMAVGLLYWVQEVAVKRKAEAEKEKAERDIPADPNEPGDEGAGERDRGGATRRCASCEHPLMDYDDICPACGEIAAFE